MPPDIRTKHVADLAWSSRYLPSIRRILGNVVIREATIREDDHEATDVVTLGRRVACRVRRPGYFDRYWRQATIRRSRPTGTRTEFAKLADGKADWLLYAHAADDARLRGYWLIDLHVWREWWPAIADLWQPARCGTQVNGDGSTFVWFDVPCLDELIREFETCRRFAPVLWGTVPQPPLVIASSYREVH